VTARIQSGLPKLKEGLEPAPGGFYCLKPELRREFDSGQGLRDELPDPVKNETAKPAVRFAITGEISTIYSRDGKTRKVHHVVVLPDFKAAEAFQAKLARVGNIASDGRPILGVDSRESFRDAAGS